MKGVFYPLPELHIWMKALYQQRVKNYYFFFFFPLSFMNNIEEQGIQLKN